MKTSRFSEPQILGILRQAEGGVPVPKLYQEHEMRTASFYKRPSKHDHITRQASSFAAIDLGLLDPLMQHG